ncbi:hypothetical protein V8G54_020391 [Vigna mungo]|uniref:AAA+ ATPase domain-containing protein n=1 Tax=Vigna mungo TaxID=3915 RepID=A0AAQ3NDM9_VIGMU
MVGNSSAASNCGRKSVISMYLMRIECRRDRLWALVLQPSKYFFRPRFSDHQYFQSLSPKYASHGRIIRERLLGSYSCKHTSSTITFAARDKRPSLCHNSSQLRAYSSESDGRNASEDKQVHVNSHARLGEQEKEEWLNNEMLTIQNKRRESPFLTRKDKFKNEFTRRIIPWEKINISWDTFPYHIHENRKNLLVECAASHLRHNKFASTYGTRLSSSSGRILLQSIPGTELYRERLVRALAQDLQVPLLVLDNSILAPYDIDDDLSSDDDNAESGKEGSPESENDDDNEVSNEEEWVSSTEEKSDASDNEDAEAAAEAHLKKVKAAVLRKLVPYTVEESEKIVAGESESSESSKSNSNDTKSSDKSGCHLKKGDRVKYTGPSVQVTDKDRPLTNGHRGEVYEVNGDQVAVILDINEDKVNEGEVENPSDDHTKPPIYWIHVKDIVNDLDAQSKDCYIAVEALCEVLRRKQPLIVYFPHISHWFHKSVPKSNRNEFFHKVEEMFDQLSGPIILICGQNKVESKENELFTMVLRYLGRIAKLPLSLKRWTEEIKGDKKSEDDEISKLFSNVLSMHPPKDENQLATFKKQLEEDKKIVISRSNLSILRKVLEEHQLSCIDLLHLNTEGIVLTKLVSRLRSKETMSGKSSQRLKALAKDEFENNFISSVVPPGEIGVKFDDVGALEDVKKSLHELVILPMRRPELFSRGNLLRPCKGILLFGPPGTGKTLLAKALATEAGANFINITCSNLTSKWFGEGEKLTKALFSFASKLTPVIIFIDEFASEHEATRRMRNEFMAAWDGLRSKEHQRILILGATNRPFDLDDAVIRRLPRRIYVDLPDAENRLKILSIFLTQENLDSEFQLDKLANLTDGYSGSDLKNLCIAAAYRPVQELLENEKKVGPSVAHDATSMTELRKWNEMHGEGGNRTKPPFGFGS